MKSSVLPGDVAEWQTRLVEGQVSNYGRESSTLSIPTNVPLYAQNPGSSNPLANQVRFREPCNRAWFRREPIRRGEYLVHAAAQAVLVLGKADVERIVPFGQAARALREC